MPKQLLVVFLSTALAIIGVSCSDNPDNFSTGNSPEDFRKDRVYELINEFYTSVHTDTRAGVHDFQISNVESRTFLLSDYYDNDNDVTRTADEEKFTLKTVSVNFKDSEGFVILSDDPRIDKILFLTEEGCISDTAYIAPLKDLVELYPAVAADMIMAGKESLTRTNSYTSVISDIVKFKWGQGYPFNNCAPYCTCTKCAKRYNHMLAGCVTVAVAQYLATRGHFSGSYYPCKDIDFSGYPAKAGDIKGLQREVISGFFREIAHNCQIKFGCDGSAGYDRAVVNYLKEIGIDCWMNEGSVNVAIAVSDLSSGKPVIISGHEDDGHMWLISGIRYKSESGVKYKSVDYYCNWGWNGLCDGWTIGNPYTAIDTVNNKVYGTFSKNLKQIYTNKW